MVTERDVYLAFRKAQSRFFKRGYNMPRDWDKHLKTRMQEKQRENLIKITKFFNTKWSNINIESYFDCGFELFKRNFSYHRFFNKRVLGLYILKDRNYKRETEKIEDTISKSIDFVADLIPEGKLSKIFRYCNMMDGRRPRAITDYIANNIDKYFLVYLMKEGLISIDREQSAQLVYIENNYERYLRVLRTFLQRNPVEEVMKKIF